MAVARGEPATHLVNSSRGTLPCSGSVIGSILDPDWPADMWERKVDARGKSHRLSASAHRALAASLAAALTVFAMQPSEAAEPGLIKIAVFDFELDDRSAGRGIIDQDAVDTENLELSTEEARRMLSTSGRYSIVDASSAAAEVIAAGGIQHCNGCDVPLAKELGADQSMVGVFTRVTRVEYTLQILVRDTQAGAVVSNASTGLRMGANYSWPRGVKWLMNNRILSAQRAE
jgi:Protein of unknown function (DUF2380)